MRPKLTVCRTSRQPTEGSSMSQSTQAEIASPATETQLRLPDANDEPEAQGMLCVVHKPLMPHRGARWRKPAFDGDM